MDKLREIIQSGEELVAKTNELLAQDIENFENAGMFQYSPMLRDLKDIDEELKKYTDDRIAVGLIVPPAGVDANEYLQESREYLELRQYIMDDLREAVREKMVKYDMAFRNRKETHDLYNRMHTKINDDVIELNASLSKTTSKIKHCEQLLSKEMEGSVFYNYLKEEIDTLENDKKAILTKIDKKNKEIQENEAYRYQLINGFNTEEKLEETVEETKEEVVEQNVEETTNLEETANLVENQEEIELPENPELVGFDGDVEENTEEQDNVVENEEDFTDFDTTALEADLDDEAKEELPEETEEEVVEEEQREELPQEEEDETLIPIGELPEEEEETEELTEEPIEEELVDDNAPVAVVSHIPAKDSLLRKIGTIVTAVIAMLGSVAAIGNFGHHFYHHKDIEKTEMESESELKEEDKEQVKDQPEETKPEVETKPEAQDPNTTPENENNNNNNNNNSDNSNGNSGNDDNNSGNNNGNSGNDDNNSGNDDNNSGNDDNNSGNDDNNHDDDKEEDKEPEEENKDDNKEEDKEPEEENKDEEQVQVNEFPVEIGLGESVVNEETGMEITSDGSAYLEVDENVTITQENRDLIETDHDTSIVVEEDMQPDQEPVETTGQEQTYEEAVTEMTNEEISNLDAAIADWAAQFEMQLNGEVQTEESELTLRP